MALTPRFKLDVWPAFHKWFERFYYKVLDISNLLCYSFSLHFLEGNSHQQCLWPVLLDYQDILSNHFWLFRKQQFLSLSVYAFKLGFSFEPSRALTVHDMVWSWNSNQKKTFTKWCQLVPLLTMSKDCRVTYRAETNFC